MHKIILYCLLVFPFILATGCMKKANLINQSGSTSVTQPPIPTAKNSGIIPQPSGNPNDPTPPTLDDVGAPDEVAVLETSKGTIVCEFFPDIAPWHVANFKKLGKSGFYNGTYFHRVLPGFVIQGGDPNTKDGDPANDGTGGPPWLVRQEFNSMQHDKGILSMARAQDVNSAGSQFFICLTRQQTAQLDNKYTVFGKVIKGMDIVDTIGATRRDPSNPKDRNIPGVTLQRVTFVKRATVQP